MPTQETLLLHDFIVLAVKYGGPTAADDCRGRINVVVGSDDDDTK